MKVLALERKLKNGEIPADVLNAEAQAVWQLQQQGKIREIYFSEKHEAVIVLETGDAEQARAALGRLPLVEHGYITFDISTLLPYDGFGRLFGKDE